MYFAAPAPIGGGRDDVLCGLLLAGARGVQGVTVCRGLNLDCTGEGRGLLFLQFWLTFCQYIMTLEQKKKIL